MANNIAPLIGYGPVDHRSAGPSDSDNLEHWPHPFPDCSSSNKAQSTADLYRKFDQDLLAVLRDLNVDVISDKLTKLDGYIVTGSGPDDFTDFVISDRLEGARKTRLLIHVAAHAILGHTHEPFRTFVEPRRGLGSIRVKMPDRDLHDGREAGLLEQAIWDKDFRSIRQLIRSAMPDKTIEVRAKSANLAIEVSDLVTDTKYKLLRRVLRSVHAQEFMYRMLDLASQKLHQYEASGLGKLLCDSGLVRGIRELYFEIGLEVEIEKSRVEAETSLYPPQFSDRLPPIPVLLERPSTGAETVISKHLMN